MPILSDSDLEQFWQIAASPTPVVIMGGGRWGRTWSIAASRARGDGTGIAIVARTDAASVRTWVQCESGFPEITVTDSLNEALERSDATGVAIVASRPRDHFRDATEAISRGLDVLVEKPISDVAQLGIELVATSRRSRRLLAVGTEFALLPSFHHCVRELSALGDNVQRARLYWDDPRFDFRHGGSKRRHEEIGVLVDLLPHAYSIFRIFSASAALRIEDANEDTSAERGWLRLQDGLGRSYELHCNKQSSARRRFLELETRRNTASIDFSDEVPRCFVNSKEMVNHDTLHMNSTLRLTLGAFLAQRFALVDSTPLSDNLDHLLHAQSDLESHQR